MDFDIVDEVHVHSGEEDERDALEDETDQENLMNQFIVKIDKAIVEMGNEPWNRA